MGRAFGRRVGLAAAAGLVVALVPTATAHQDLVTYLARQSGADQTWRRHVAAQVHPSMRVASFAFSRPLSAEGGAPRLTLARLGARDEPAGRLGQIIGPALIAEADGGSPIVNRAAKGDLLVERARLRLGGAAKSVTGEAPGAAPLIIASLGSLMHDGALAAALPPSDAAPTLTLADIDERMLPETLAEDRAGLAAAHFGPIGRAGVGLGVRPFAEEQAARRIAGAHEPVAGFDPMLDAFSTDRRGDRPDPVLASLFKPPPPLHLAAPGPEPRRQPFNHPALSLNLADRALARAEKCLAEAVYWEARGEPENGQIAVAQVVVNRAVSGFYPRDVCGVVYQNAHRYLACQFTFACEGRRNLTPTEPEPWRLAQRIARDMMAGRAWIPQVGHATHYHANYVRPWWARSMNRLKTIGVHLFYRPREWGPGES